MSTVPQELNWVQKRAACSPVQIFKELRTGIDNDVAFFNSLQNFHDNERFAAVMTKDGSTLGVGQYGNTPGVRVLIGVVGERIEVRDETKQCSWAADVKLNSEGRCTLKLEDGTELEQWQFRKNALARIIREGSASGAFGDRGSLKTMMGA
jgi:hypothetical protein